MATVSNKRKDAYAHERPAKRMRIERQSLFMAGHTGPDDLASDGDSNTSYEEDSDDVQSQDAETPLTPLSPPRKFPSDLKTIKCTYKSCNKSFNRPARLAAHLRSHVNERPFACSYAECDKTYIEEKHLKQHVKGYHAHEKPYECDWDGCNKSFLTATRLRRHREAHEGHERFRCTAYPPCNETFRKHQTLQRHIRAEHLQLAPFPCAFVDPVNQVTCGAGFDSSGALRKHEDRVHGALRFWCDECSTSDGAHNQDVTPKTGFRTKDEFTKHIRSEHSNCIFCDLKCSSQVELQRHVETQHSGTGIMEPSNTLAERKTLSCSFPGCSKSFTKKYNLGVHVRSAHDGQRFTCSATSTISNNIKSPELTLWTGVNACGKDFVSKSNLEDHIRTQHLGFPSTLNGKRSKIKSTQKKNSQKSEIQGDDMDAINLLTGAAYAQDSNRNISCLISNCEWLFTRHYDLTLHLRSAHNLSASEIEASTKAQPSDTDPYDPDDHDALEAVYNQADLEWDTQRIGAATAGKKITSFWIGAENEDNRIEGMEAWEREQEEMRRLCHREGEWNSVLDPELRNL